MGMEEPEEELASLVTESGSFPVASSLWSEDLPTDVSYTPQRRHLPQRVQRHTRRAGL